MDKFFPRAEERSFTASVARARFLWLLVAALLLPLAASLAHEADQRNAIATEALR
jgi:hypothetical protein